MQDCPYIVYHYCSLEAFFSIITHSTIRLTNISKSNDCDEIHYCFNIFEDTLRSSCKGFSQKYIEDVEIKKFFNEINYNKLVTKAVINESLIYYVACFSSESDLLSQWRGYANDGKGVAIGFYSKNFISSRNFKNIKYDRITYNMDNVKEKLHDYIFEKLTNAHSEDNNKLSISVYMNAINDIISEMVYNAVFCKNPAFKEENEWRLVYYPFGNIRNLLIDHKSKDLSSNQLFYDRMYETIAYNKEYNGLIRSNIKFKCTDDKIISFVEMNFENIKKMAIAEIVIGAKSKIDDKDLRLFLLSNEYNLSNIIIKKSTATYQ